MIVVVPEDNVIRRLPPGLIFDLFSRPGGDFFPLNYGGCGMSIHGVSPKWTFADPMVEPASTHYIILFHGFQ